MLIVDFVFAGFFVTVHSSNIFEATDACVTISSGCTLYTINCTVEMMMVTRILFETASNSHNQCTDCLDTVHVQTYDITDGIYGGYTNDILQACSFQHSCELRHYDTHPRKIGIRYKCISGQIITGPCGIKFNVLNNGDQHHIVLRRSSENGTCSCVINGSTELRVQDFFTKVCHSIEPVCTVSNSVLLLNNLAFSNGTNIVHSGISYANVSNITIHFDEIFQRLWLSISVTENGTRIWCTDSDSSTHSTTLSVVTSGVTSTSAYSTTTLTEPNIITNATAISTHEPDAIVTSAAVSTEPTSQSLPQSTSTGKYPVTSGYWNTTYDKAKTSTSVIVYVASVSSVVVVVLIVVGSIVVIRRIRKKDVNKSTKGAEHYANVNFLAYEDMARPTRVEHEHEYQTVISCNSIENAMS